MTADRFFTTFKKKEGSFTDKTEAVSVHPDDPKSKSSIQIWNFIVDGADQGEENKLVSFSALEGDVLKLYKIKLDVVPKDDGVCIAKWTWEYKKLNDDVPPPTTRDLETRLLSEI
ncbi:unnamed protein product [Microthlaspi erraticum]|uniref:Bet v I/Major latex protein domain-containing protein n=1 Tax=Microthlaspi erraticum TaxID=1685480 RepID=A0A6D2L4I4_9BRAS|nr:unnamed protein product [Microthlaspi erraticum]